MTGTERPSEEGRRAETGRAAGDLEKAPGLGCAWTMIAFNALAMGLVALAFTTRPYFSTAQELWYRYGSLAFLAGGALLPALLLAVRPSRTMAGALTAWMILVAFAFVHYLLAAGGGMM